MKESASKRQKISEGESREEGDFSGMGKDEDERLAVIADDDGAASAEGEEDVNKDSSELMEDKTSEDPMNAQFVQTYLKLTEQYPHTIPPALASFPFKGARMGVVNGELVVQPAVELEGNHGRELMPTLRVTRSRTGGQNVVATNVISKVSADLSQYSVRPVEHTSTTKKKYQKQREDLHHTWMQVAVMAQEDVGEEISYTRGKINKCSDMGNAFVAFLYAQPVIPKCFWGMRGVEKHKARSEATKAFKKICLSKCSYDDPCECHMNDEKEVASKNWVFSNGLQDSG